MVELTSTEVAALFDLDERRLRKEVEHGVLDHVESPPRFTLSDVVYLYTLAQLGVTLAVDDRRKLYRLITEALTEDPVRNVELGTYVLERVASAARDVQARLDAFAKWKRKLVLQEDLIGGEPAFPKSRLSVRHIGEMARRGATASEIREDYPELSDSDIEFAKRFVNAYPRKGRPPREAAAR